MVEQAIRDALPPRILVVEDDDILRSFLVEALELSDYVMDSAGTCAEGRATFIRGRYACALIDLGLPDGDGLALLGEFVREDPELVSIVITGDAAATTVIDTMRAGAFDYLTKPVELATLNAAVARGLAHHTVRRERAELLELLVQERDQLRARVEEATSDLRLYAQTCERSNAHLRALLRLTQLAGDYLSDEILLQQVLEHLSEEMPLRALVLCDVGRGRLSAVVRKEGQPPAFISSDAELDPSGYDPLLAEVEPGRALEVWFERVSGLSLSELKAYLFDQSFANRPPCAVGFFLEPSDDDVSALQDDPVLSEFLDMCAYFLAFEWEQGKLLLHVAHQASLGNIAVELARTFVQPLTAIRTAAEIVDETVVSPEAAEGITVVMENVERLRRQMQEFQRLAVLREDSVETVRLDDYIEQALDMLAVAIQNRNVTVEKDFRAEGECVLLNGTVLARTFLDLILGALRTVEVGSTVSLSLADRRRDWIAFDIRYRPVYPEAVEVSSPALRAPDEGVDRSHPGLQLALRAVHSCGGTLTVEREPDKHVHVCIVLPRNVTRVANRSRGGGS